MVMDTEVAKVYGWDDLELAHDFYEAKQGLRRFRSKRDGSSSID